MVVRRGSLALPEAALRDNLTVVRQLLEHGAKPNKTEFVLTSIGWASHNGNIEMFNLLLQYGARINKYIKKYPTTVLIEAAERDHADMAKFLLDKNIPLDFEDRDGMTALSYAAGNYNFELVKLLTEKGADVNHKNRRGQSIMELAVDDAGRMPADSNIIYYLVNKGANISPEVFKGVCYTSQTHLAEYFIDHGFPITQDLIVPAIQSGNLNFVRSLESDFHLSSNYFDPGSNVNSLFAATYGYLSPGAKKRKLNVDLLSYILTKTPDSIFIKAGPRAFANLFQSDYTDSSIAACAELFINKGISVNALSDSFSGASFLMNAVSIRSQQTIKLLTEHGARVNYKDKLGRSAISMASEYGNTNSIEYLIAHGADINLKDANERTPIMNAALASSFENIRLLAERGADLNLKDRSGKTVLDYAQDESIKAYLVSKGAKKGD